MLFGDMWTLPPPLRYQVGAEGWHPALCLLPTFMCQYGLTPLLVLVKRQLYSNPNRSLESVVCLFNDYVYSTFSSLAKSRVGGYPLTTADLKGCKMKGTQLKRASPRVMPFT